MPSRQKASCTKCNCETRSKRKSFLPMQQQEQPCQGEERKLQFFSRRIATMALSEKERNFHVRDLSQWSLEFVYAALWGKQKRQQQHADSFFHFFFRLFSYRGRIFFNCTFVRLLLISLPARFFLPSIVLFFVCFFSRAAF